MNLTLLSPASPSYGSVTAITRPNKEEYCKRWNIPASFPSYLDAATDKGYGRIAFIRERLQWFDWLWFIDADALILNMEIDARQYCREDADLVVAWDGMGLQSGSMFLRNCPKVIELLDRTLEAKNIDGRGDNFMASSDQGAMVRLLSQRYEYANNIPCSECQAFGVRVFQHDNSINQYEQNLQPGDFVLHAPGMSMEEKRILLERNLSKIQRGD